MLSIPGDPAFYAVGLLATFLIGLSKGAFGGGLAIVGVPLLAPVTSPIEAAIITAYLVAAMDLFALKSFGTAQVSRPDLGWLMAGLVAGIAVGWAVFASVDPRWVGLIVGVVTLVFCAQFFLAGDRVPAAIAASPRLALVAGSASGFTTFVAHAGGPPVAMYLLARGLDKTAFAATNIVVFMLGNYLKLIPFTAFALAHPGAFGATLALLPMVPLGVWAGVRLHRRLERRRLFFWCYVLLTFAAAKLVWDAVAGAA